MESRRERDSSRGVTWLSVVSLRLVSASVCCKAGQLLRRLSVAASDPPFDLLPRQPIDPLAESCIKRED